MLRRKSVTIAEKPTKPVPPVDPTKSLKETIADLRQEFEAAQSHNRALRAQTNNQLACNSALADGLKAERGDLQARIDRIDLRLKALGFGFEQHTTARLSSQPDKY